MIERGGRVEALETRLRQCHAFGSLRRVLRATEKVEAVAATAERFAIDVLGLSCFALYWAENAESDFDLLSSTPASLAVPRTIERRSAMAEALAEAESTRRSELLLPFGGGPESVAFALRASPAELVGILMVAGESLGIEMLAELAFDVESALSAIMITRLRTEELALLEIQEHELVGLLHDVEARDATIQRDLEEARHFQRMMLGELPRVGRASVEVVYEPLALVGGDFYAVSVDGHRIRLFVADATGHGVRASLTTMVIKSGYEAVRLAASDPAALLAALNDTIAHTYRSSEMLFSAACADIDLATGRVITASGAHPAICIVRRGEARFFEGIGGFLGVSEGMRFTTDEDVMEEGDGIYLYTDGFIEARKNRQLFGHERFREAVLEAHLAGRPAGEGVLAAVRSFLDGTPLDDDSTFVGVRYGSSAS